MTDDQRNEHTNYFDGEEYRLSWYSQRVTMVWTEGNYLTLALTFQKKNTCTAMKMCLFLVVLGLCWLVVVVFVCGFCVFFFVVCCCFWLLCVVLCVVFVAHRSTLNAAQAGRDLSLPPLLKRHVGRECRPLHDLLNMSPRHIQMSPLNPGGSWENYSGHTSIHKRADIKRNIGQAPLSSAFYLNEARRRASSSHLSSI